ncbi:BREX-1 system phosphatase PglZ type A, partial [Actinomycetota bacterium]|nr:BREX-1 system phosphatase PglZ type A [Actinomycetota bacterium]
MNNPAAVLPHLKQRFQSNRIVFWHDPESQHSDDLDALDLPGVTKIRVANNEYGIKHRLLHTEPAEKFLIYRSGKVPAGIENWLLDLELAYGVFAADRSSLIAQDLGLAIDGMSEVVQSHEKFFNSIKRVETLKALVNPEDNSTQIRAKMTAVILRLKDSHTMLEITRTLIVENAKGATDKYEALV